MKMRDQIYQGDRDSHMALVGTFAYCKLNQFEFGPAISLTFARDYLQLHCILPLGIDATMSEYNPES